MVIVSVKSQKLGLDQSVEQGYLLVLNCAADSNLTLKEPLTYHPGTGTHCGVFKTQFPIPGPKLGLNMDRTLLLPQEIGCSGMTPSHERT